MKSYDCVVCGSCVTDVLCRAVPLTARIGAGRLLDVEPPQVQPGGITVNVGIALARMGLSVAALSLVGADEWGALVRSRLRAEGVDDEYLVSHPVAPTRTTVVLVDEDGHRSLLCGPGASQYFDRALVMSRLDLFARSRMCLLGYFGHMPALQDDLPEVMHAIRATGCMTAMDAAPGTGSMALLERILPHLDIYVPSWGEAREQTGEEDPRKIVAELRRHGAAGVVGVKLGAEGAVLSEAPGHFAELPALPPPGPVVDTTGAGDAFYAGLLGGLLRGLPPVEAARLGLAAGAQAVTVRGGCGAVRDYPSLRRLAGLAA